MRSSEGSAAEGQGLGCKLFLLAVLFGRVWRPRRGAQGAEVPPAFKSAPRENSQPLPRVRPDSPAARPERPARGGRVRTSGRPEATSGTLTPAPRCSRSWGSAKAQRAGLPRLQLLPVAQTTGVQTRETPPAGESRAGRGGGVWWGGYGRRLGSRSWSHAEGLGEGCWYDEGRWELGRGEWPVRGEAGGELLGPRQCLAPPRHGVRPSAWDFTTQVPRRRRRREGPAGAFPGGRGALTVPGTEGGVPPPSRLGSNTKTQAFSPAERLASTSPALSRDGERRPRPRG